MLVAPSILSADFACLADSCRPLVSAHNNWLHIDVMDGLFVPNITLGAPVLACLTRAIPGAFYDVHLMIQRPADYVDAFAKAGANGITLHLESEGDTRLGIAAIRAAGCKVGLSLRPGTPVEQLFPYLAEIDMVLVMSVEPGFGGQSFMPEAPGRIAAIRAEAARQGTPLLIEVDGGINAETAGLCADAGADILVAGSALFGAADPVQMLQTLATAGK